MEPWFSSVGQLGYAVKDINHDGTLELLLLDPNNVGWGSSKGPFIYALFTLKDNKPVQLGQYWRREHAQIGADGTIYVVADHSHLYSYKLKAGASELTKLTEYHGELGGERSEKIIDTFMGPYEGAQTPISEEEFLRIFKKHDTPPNPMQFQFIPIEQ